MSSTDATIMGSAEEYGLVTHDVPKEMEAIFNYAFDPVNSSKPIWHIIGTLTVSMIKRKRELTIPERQMVFDILQSLSSIAVVTSEAEKRLQIKAVLNCIMGETPKATGPYTFPDPFPRDAESILARVENDLAFEEEIEASPSPSPPPNNKRKRSQKSATPRRSAPRQPIDMSDPNMAAMLRNIDINDEGNRRSYKLKHKFDKVASDVIGRNGLQVGQWWPLRICALRDGAHGAMQAGIAGGATEGTYSIVVSSEVPAHTNIDTLLILVTDAYEGMDKDEGNVIIYSGSNSHDNEDPKNPVLTHATNGMRLAFKKRRPIRVIRTAGSPWKGAPRVGLRYDGLYTILEEKSLKNRNGGAYLAFKLVRDAGQPEIITSRPDVAEKKTYDRLKGSL